MVILNASYTPTKRELQIYFAVRLHQTPARLVELRSTMKIKRPRDGYRAMLHE